MLLDAVEHHGFGSWLVTFQLETICFIKCRFAVEAIAVTEKIEGR